MKIKRFLVIGKKPRQKAMARLSVNPPSMESHEVAIQLTIDVPDELFVKPQLSAQITVPKDAISPPVIDAEVVDNIQAVVSKELGVNLEIAVIEQAG